MEPSGAGPLAQEGAAHRAGEGGGGGGELRPWHVPGVQSQGKSPGTLQPKPVCQKVAVSEMRVVNGWVEEKGRGLGQSLGGVGGKVGAEVPECQAFSARGVTDGTIGKIGRHC